VRRNKTCLLSQETISQRITLSGKLTQISYGLFIALFSLNFYQLYRPEALFHWVVLLLQLAPIMLFLPAFVKLHRKGVLGFTFVLMIYFCFSIINLERSVAWPWLTYLEIISEALLLLAIVQLGKYLNLEKLKALQSLPQGC